MMAEGEYATVAEHNRGAVGLYQHAFLSALASWMSKPRSEEECKTLWGARDPKEEMRLCKEAGCDFDDPFVALLHEIGVDHHSRPVARTAFRIMSATLSGAVQATKTAKSTRRVERAVDTAGVGRPWPTKITDLLGDFPVEHYFKQMEVWIVAWAGYSDPYCILGSLAILYPHQFLARIAYSTNVSVHTVVVLNFIKECSLKNLKSGGDLLTELASTMHLVDSLLNGLSEPLLIQFIQVKGIVAEITILCSDLLKEVPRMLSDLGPFPGWRENEADRCTKTLLRFGSTMHAYTGMADDQFDGVKLDRRMLRMSHAKRQRASGTITGAFDAFCSLAEWQRCFAPGCTSVVAAAALLKCANCGRVLYCSTTCQKEAWKHPIAPHRVLCKRAKALASHTGLPPRPQSSADLDSFYQRIDGNEEMEKVAKDFGECFKKLTNSLEQIFAREKNLLLFIWPAKLAAGSALGPPLESAIRARGKTKEEEPKSYILSLQLNSEWAREENASEFLADAESQRGARLQSGVTKRDRTADLRPALFGQ
ncbi:hypothetical protein DFH07DRAFT_767834 [Mycena maculata]|uniref:MYND-type domain-containing protein n=1 Tax=Mycena maculata TaxID=230809 RepID=A0AAD7JW09_9AGAR|nr:hypothetical protein DFH07DRAFT_767834 [Mycena maculata]